MEQDIEFKRKVNEIIKKILPEILQSSGFSNRKLTDTPADAYQVVARKYVNLNGTVANRPNASVATIGQFYFPTDTNIPMRFDGSKWRNGIGSIVA